MSTATATRTLHVTHATTDEELEARCSKALLKSGYYSHLKGVTVSAKVGGIVTLTGNVPDFTMKQKAQEVIRKVTGVTRIANNTDVPS